MKWLQRFEAMMMAISFAEAGEYETALSFVGKRIEKRKNQKSSRVPTLRV
jgi:hypothetical protein